jgi:hypothetical protein
MPVHRPQADGRLVVDQPKPVSDPPHAIPTKAIRCPQCGGAITLRALGQSVMVACPYCRSQMDVSQPEIKLIRTYREQAMQLRIPLGTRGALHGQLFEVIGALGRACEAGRWEEFLLFNPYAGFRWLVYDEGHWSLGQTVKDTSSMTLVTELRYHERGYRRFTHGNAVTEWVVGEFYWRASAGDRAETIDYVSPPMMLSREKSHGEITWTSLQYLAPEEVETAFKVSSPPRTFVAANQPNPAAVTLHAIKPIVLWSLAAALLLQILTGILSRRIDYTVGTYEVPARGTPEVKQVFGPYRFDASHSANELTASAAVSNSWVELNGSLVNVDTGQSFDFNNEFEYYYGTDSDGFWSEGSGSGTATLPQIPAGSYKLIVEGASGANDPTRSVGNVSLTLHHNVLIWGNFWIAVVVLLLYPSILFVQRLTFERERWSESELPGNWRSG